MNLIANRRVLQREIGIGDASHKLLGRRRRSERGWIIMRQPPCRARAGREIWAAEYKSAAGCGQGVWREVLAANVSRLSYVATVKSGLCAAMCQGIGTVANLVW